MSTNLSMKKNKLNLLFIIRLLDYGGAERQLIELVKGLDKTRFFITVVTFYDGGNLRPQLEEVEGIKVISLSKKGRWDIGPFAWRLWKVTRQVKPDIIHGYMDLPNLVSLVLAKLVGAKAVWGIRASRVELANYDPLQNLIFRLGAFLSRFVDLIITNSYAGKSDHIMQGYCGKRMVVIPNGINTGKFYPQPEVKAELYAEWKIGRNKKLIGYVGRLDPQKDYPTFLRSAAALLKQREDVSFVCTGTGAENYSRVLKALASELGLDNHLTWASGRSDMPAVYNSLDILTLSSCYGEGFPNVVGEAMACGVPAVVTDNGDSALIVRDEARIIKIGDSKALVEAWLRLLDLEPAERQALAGILRERIIQNFSVSHLITHTTKALESIL
ncbi:MAG TPA: glycosyltransferase [Chloroflexia bacterium]|nr:glycosyltransferase [Chloroflexia bacterium]